jgi:hypothetical protein
VWCAGPVTPGKAVDNALWKVEETTLLDLEKEKWGSRRDSDIGFESAGTQTFIFKIYIYCIEEEIKIKIKIILGNQGGGRFGVAVQPHACYLEALAVQGLLRPKYSYHLFNKVRLDCISFTVFTHL